MSGSGLRRAMAVLVVCALAPVAPASIAGASGVSGVHAAGIPDEVASPAAGVATADLPLYAERQILVRFEPTATAAARSQAHAAVGATVKHAYRLVSGLQLVTLSGRTSVEKAIAAYEAMPGVAYATPDYYVVPTAAPDDPLFGDQWGLENTGQIGGTADADIDGPEAWDWTTGDSDVIVAVIDSGVDYNHPDLAGNMWTNPGEIAGNHIDDDGNGYVDDVHGWDATNEDGDPMDDLGHGTHCAGTVGAQGGNAIGVTGVSQDVSIMALKMIAAAGYGLTSDAIECFEYMDVMGVHVSSNSWGALSTTYVPAERDAIAASDALFVCAAGNDGVDIDGTPTFYPAGYALDNIISVGASDEDDLPADFSNRGDVRVDLFAPGTYIKSTAVADTPGDYADAYEWRNGTSSATPHVAGVAALLLAQDPARTTPELKQLILDTVDIKASLAGLCVTSGRLNAFAALGHDAPNVAPVADNESVAVERNSQRVVAAPGVLENDTDMNSDVLSAVLVSGPSHGTLDLDSNGGFTYTPEEDFLGTDSFTYRASDGLLTSDIVTVPITVMLPKGIFRVAGTDRYLTSVEASKAGFTSADTVVIATGANWPDALGGSALAGAADGPLLLTTPGALPAAVASEIERLGATKAYILGGESAISAQVEVELAAMLGADGVERVAGENRYATARAIAEEAIGLLGDGYGGGVLVATGANFPDATGASPLAAALGRPIVLVNPGNDGFDLPVGATSALILGGAGVVSADVEAALRSQLGSGNVERVGGANRYETAALVAQAGVNAGMTWVGVGLATGENFPDALAGGAMLGSFRSVMLLTTSAQLRPEAEAKLRENRVRVRTLHAVGGDSAIAPATLEAAAKAALVH